MRRFLVLLAVTGLGFSTATVAAKPPSAISNLQLTGAEASAYDPETQRWEGPFTLTWTNPPDAFRVDWRLAVGDAEFGDWEWALPITGPWAAAPARAGADTLVVDCFEGLVPGGRYLLVSRVINAQGERSAAGPGIPLLVPGESSAFADTVDFQGQALYAWGRPIPESRVEVRCDAGVLSINGYPRDGGRYKFTESRDVREQYEKSPVFAQLVSSGVDSTEAALRVHWSINNLARRANLAAGVGGMEAGLAVFRASPLVARAENVEGVTVEVFCTGIDGTRMFNLGGGRGQRCVYVDYAVLEPTAARGLARWFVKEARRTANASAVFLVAGGGMILVQQDRDLALFRAQLDHMAHMGSPYLMPDGPLTDMMAAEFMTAGR